MAHATANKRDRMGDICGRRYHRLAGRLFGAQTQSNQCFRRVFRPRSGQINGGRSPNNVSAAKAGGRDDCHHHHRSRNYYFGITRMDGTSGAKQERCGVNDWQSKNRGAISGNSIFAVARHVFRLLKLPSGGYLLNLGGCGAHNMVDVLLFKGRFFKPTDLKLAPTPQSHAISA